MFAAVAPLSWSIVLYVLAGCISTCAIDRDTAPANIVCRYVRSLEEEAVAVAVAAASTVVVLVWWDE